MWIDCNDLSFADNNDDDDDDDLLYFEKLIDPSK